MLISMYSAVSFNTSKRIALYKNYLLLFIFCFTDTADVHGELKIAWPMSI